MTQTTMTQAQRFALNQWLSDFPETMSYGDIIQAMHDEKHTWTHPDITVWYVVENFPLSQVAQFIEDTCQHFENVTV